MKKHKKFMNMEKSCLIFVLILLILPNITFNIGIIDDTDNSFGWLTTNQALFFRLSGCEFDCTDTPNEWCALFTIRHDATLMNNGQ